MSNTRKIVPKIIETQSDRVSSEVVPGSVILERDTGRVSFDASNGERCQVKDPTKLPVEGGTLEGDVDLGTHQITKDYTEGNLSNLEDNVLLNKGEVDEMTPPSDYDSFDETSKSFIKNRPFYSRKSKLSGNIVKNPVYDKDSSIYACDKIGLSLVQSEEVIISLTNPDTGEVLNVQGLIGTCGELMGSDAAEVSDCVVLYARIEGEVTPLFVDGARPDSTTYSGLTPADDCSASVLESINVSTIDVEEIKYLDPAFVRPYASDYAETDPKNIKFIKNKIINKVIKPSQTLKPQTYFLEECIPVVYGWGLIPNDSKEVTLEIKFKDGTVKSYVSSPNVNDSQEDESFSMDNASFAELMNFYDPDDSSVLICTIISFAGAELGSSTNSNIYLGTLMLCGFDEEFFKTMDSFTLSGDFLSATVISQELVYGLKKDLSELRKKDEESTQTIADLTEENNKLKDIIYSINWSINHERSRALHNNTNLKGYLQGVTIADEISYNGSYGSDITGGIGSSGWPFKISAVDLTYCFNHVRWRDYDYKSFLKRTPDVYLTLLNAEILDNAFYFELEFSRDYTDPNSKTEHSVIVSITLCHDIVSAKDAFSMSTYYLKEFRLSGDSSLGRRVKIYGTNQDTFNLSSSYRVESGYEFNLYDLEFMDSVDFHCGSPVAANVDYMVNIIDSLHDYSLDEGELPTDKYCTFNKGKDLLSAEQIKVATDKGWKIN